MEEHAVAANLARSRAQIRQLVLPPEGMHVRTGGTFPRSTVMRFLMDSGKRRMALGVATTLFMMLGRRRAAPVGAWPDITRSLSAVLGALQSRRR